MTTSTFTSSCPFDAPANSLARAQRVAGAVRFSELLPENIRWLWPGRIPLGYVTLLVSDPGAGKSLVALDIAARVSTGAPWPDQEGQIPSSSSPQASPSPPLQFSSSTSKTISRPLSALASKRSAPIARGSWVCHTCRAKVYLPCRAHWRLIAISIAWRC